MALSLCYHKRAQMLKESLLVYHLFEIQYRRGYCVHICEDLHSNAHAKYFVGYRKNTGGRDPLRKAHSKSRNSSDQFIQNVRFLCSIAFRTNQSRVRDMSALYSVLSNHYSISRHNFQMRDMKSDASFYYPNK